MRARRRARIHSEMPYATRSRLWHCTVERRTIFFDIAAGRYFALPANLQSAFEYLDKSPSSITRGDMERLQALGVVERSSGSVRCRSAISLAPTSDRQSIVVRMKPRTGLLVRALLLQLLCTAMLRVLRFERVMDLVASKRRRARIENDDPVEADEIAAAFRFVGILLSREGQCLPRSIAFAWLCWNRRYDVDLIIGVRINPFSAHCWVQKGAIVMNDAADRVVVFKPIFAL